MNETTKKTSHIFCIEMNESTQKTSHISCTEMNETTKKTSHISCTEMDETPNKHHKYFTLKCVKPQKAPHLSCIEMHDTTRLLHMCHEPRPTAIDKIIFCTVVGSLNRSILGVCKWSLNWCWAGFLSFNIEKN